jgi:hypothetical protein
MSNFDKLFTKYHPKRSAVDYTEGLTSEEWRRAYAKQGEAMGRFRFKKFLRGLLANSGWLAGHGYRTGLDGRSMPHAVYRPPEWQWKEGELIPDGALDEDDVVYNREVGKARRAKGT